MLNLSLYQIKFVSGGGPAEDCISVIGTATGVGIALGALAGGVITKTMNGAALGGVVGGLFMGSYAAGNAASCKNPGATSTDFGIGGGNGGGGYGVTGAIEGGGGGGAGGGLPRLSVREWAE